MTANSEPQLESQGHREPGGAIASEAASDPGSLVGAASQGDASFSIAAVEEAVRGAETGWPERIAALETLTRFHHSLEEPGTPVSPQRLGFEAELLGLKLERHATVFRVDTRGPEEIGKVGFLPRQDKPSGSLLLHVESKTGNMVSATHAEGNPIVFGGLACMGHLSAVGEDKVRTLNTQMAESLERDIARLTELMPQITPWQYSIMDMASFTPGGIDEMVATFKRFETQFLALPEALRTVLPEYASQLPKSQREAITRSYAIYAIRKPEAFEGTQTYRAFEYRVNDVDGVAWGREFPGFMFAEQREVTIPAAAPDKVVAVREVVVHAKYAGWHPETGIMIDPKAVTVESGEWQQIKRD